jgi:hypothetical protein
MAWRPHELLIEGELSNRVRGMVTGFLTFRGLGTPVVLSLGGDFHRDIRGAAIRISGNPVMADEGRAQEYMEGFSCIQTGHVGDMTAGRQPIDYVDYPYFEWYSTQNGRIVLELSHEQVTVVGEPLPWQNEKRNDPDVLQERFRNFVAGLSRS